MTFIPMPNIFQKNKLNFFEESNYADKTKTAMQNLYINYILDIEKQSGKDVFDFTEIEISQCNKKVSNFNKSTIGIINAFIKSYIIWFSKKYHKNRELFKLESKKKVDKSWYISKKDFFNMCKNMLETTSIYNILPLILVRYGISGKQMIFARSLRWRDINYKTNEVIIKNDKKEIDLNIKVDVEFLKWLDIAKFKSMKKYSEFDENSYVLLEKKHEIINYNTFNSRIHKACNSINIQRIALNNLEFSAKIDYLHELSNIGYNIDFDTVKEKIKVWYPNEVFSHMTLYNLVYIYHNWVGDVIILHKKIKILFTLVNKQTKKIRLQHYLIAMKRYLLNLQIIKY